ncbi:MAG: type I polyketide synthase, partial [Planctomycetota bacterium]
MDSNELAADAQAFAARVRTLPRPSAARELAAWLTTELVEFLGFDADEQVEQDDTFPDLGFDSLRAVDFKQRLEVRLACELDTTLLFDCPTPRVLAEYLARVLTPAPSSGPAANDSPRSVGPIAITGIGCRFGGGVRGPDALWRLCHEGREGIGPIPPSRWDVDACFDPDPATPGRTYVRRGAFVDDVDRFDAGFFGISPREAADLDPQQRLLLETVWETLEHAGMDAERLRGEAVGVFVGNRGAEYFQGQTHWAPEDASAYYGTGNSASTLAGRLSFTLGLTGPCLALDTACSSSLVALHLALRSLRAGECRAALVGGVNLIVDPFGTIALSKASMLSPDGRCKTFDAAADGYVRSEGVAAVYLEPLASARAAGRRVLGILRGTAINSDGASGGLTVPSRPAQVAVIRAALADAQLEPHQVDAIEAHGTGTSLGDPIEVNALDDVFRDGRERPLLVSSVKTNIGHTEPTAGLAGLIRAVLSLEHELLPAHLNLETPNPHIDWERSIVDVPTTERVWPRGAHPRRVGISSFGFSGTNAHAIVEEAPTAEPDQASAPERPVEVVRLTAHDGPALERLAARVERASAGTPAASLARATTLGRAALSERAYWLGRAPRWAPPRR